MKANPTKAYARAGVDVELGNALKRGIQSIVRSTHGPEVLGKIGGFGGLFRANFRGMKDPVLVSSVDGVGTKLKVAFAMERHDTVGQDLVNHCINDIAVLGARPLFYYIAAGKARTRCLQAASRRSGKKRRKAARCALVGGEDDTNARHVSGRGSTTWPAPSSALWTARRCSMVHWSGPATFSSDFLRTVCIPTAFRWREGFYSRI